VSTAQGPAFWSEGEVEESRGEGIKTKGGGEIMGRRGKKELRGGKSEA